MPRRTTVDEIIQLAGRLSPLEKLKLIERLTPGLRAELMPRLAADHLRALDEQYQRGYEQVPEETVELRALLPHLALPPEQWE